MKKVVMFLFCLSVKVALYSSDRELISIQQDVSKLRDGLQQSGCFAEYVEASCASFQAGAVSALASRRGYSEEVLNLLGFQCAAAREYVERLNVAERARLDAQGFKKRRSRK